jgi:predicted metal-dependent phosphoesterase TrpH
MNNSANMKPVISEIHHIGNDWGWFIDTDKSGNVHYKKKNVYTYNSYYKIKKTNYNLNPKINYNFTEAKNDVVLQIKRVDTDLFINANENENKNKNKEKQTIYTITKLAKFIKQTFVTLSYSAICGVLVTYIIYGGM